MTAGLPRQGLLPLLRRRPLAGAEPPGGGVSEALAPAPMPTLIDRLRGPLEPLAELLLEQTNSGVLILDRKGLLVRANARLRLMIGAATPLIGQPAMLLFALEEREALWERLRALLLGQVAPTAMMARIAREGADDLAVETSPLVLREADGSASGLILRLADVSAQRLLEAQLAQSQKLQAVGQLAAGIAHDFNNLLTAVVGAAELIEARAGSEAATRADAAEIRGSAERGAALVRQLLAFGRQQALRPTALSINEAIRGLSGLLSRLLGSAIALELDLEDPGCSACVDPTQLDQVLINLAVNARDAMPQGGTLTLRSGHIALYRPLVRGAETIPPGRYVMIEVQDTGEGIDPELLPRIFDPFVTTRRERGGTGLGLSTVHGIIRQSDGFLGVESIVGQGTRMRIYLPRHDVAVARIPAVPGDSAPAMRAPDAGAEVRPAVLLVDDEASVRRLGERALTAAGWHVLAAESGQAALELVRDQAPLLRLLVSDVMMPELDGPALAEILRRTWPGLPVLFVSGYADERLRGTLGGDMVGFLAKPYRLAELTARAQAMLGQRETMTASARP